MQDDCLEIIRKLEQDAEQLKDAWPDSFGAGFSRWILNSVQDVTRVGSKTEELKARAKAIRKYCSGILGEDGADGEDVRILAKKL